MRKRTRIAVTALVAVLGFGAAGLAWAAYTETTQAEAAGGAGGDLLPVATASPTYIYDNPPQNQLFPDHEASVTFQVTNPNHIDVNVTGISAGAGWVNVTGGTNPNNNATRTICEGKLSADTPVVFLINGNPTTLIPANSTVTVKLVDAINLAVDAPNSCQGMVFDTEWDIAIANA